MNRYTRAQIEQIIHSNPEDPVLRARIKMYGPLNRSTGYGNHFVELVLGLLKLGADINMWPYHVFPPLPPEILATMMEPWDNEAPVGICMANPTRLRRIAEHTIGITTWETSLLPPDHLSAIDAIDEFIVPSEDNIALINKVAPGKRVRFIPEGIDVNFWQPVERDWAASPLKIAMFGALTYRKGVDLAIEAFSELYAGDPSVELHVWQTSVEPRMHFLNHIPNVTVQLAGWQSREEVRAWFNDKHALLAPYRGEGFYLPGAEFMATGGILIAPDKMGARYYLNDNRGYVIPSHWGPVLHWHDMHGPEATEAFGDWVAYEPEAVRETLRKFVEDSPSVKREKSHAASAEVPCLCDPISCAQQVLDTFLQAHLDPEPIAA